MTEPDWEVFQRPRARAGTSRPRTPPERSPSWVHRRRLRRIRELTARRDALQAQIDALEEEYEADWWALCDKFGCVIPEDPTGDLYDILDRVEPMPDGGWRWLGGLNNKGLPVLKRSASSEVSVVRYLAVAFGVVDKDWEGILYPLRKGWYEEVGYVDVQPFRRRPRALPPGKRRGNPTRHTAPR